MTITRPWHVRSWMRIKDRLRQRAQRRRARALDSNNLPDGGLNCEVPTAVAKATASVMAQRIGIHPLKLSDDPWHHDDIVRKCSACAERAACRLWLADPDADADGYLEFCPNAQRFQNLKEQR